MKKKTVRRLKRQASQNERLAQKSITIEQAALTRLVQDTRVTLGQFHQEQSTRIDALEQTVKALALRMGLAVALLVLLVAAPTCAQTTAVLAWDANPVTENVIGYTAFVGTASAIYPNAYDTGLATTLRFVIPDVTKTYYFAVQARNVDGLGAVQRSPYSNEVNWSQSPTPCSATLVGPATVSSGINTGTLQLTVSTTCAPWTMTSSQPWVTVAPTMGTGNSAFDFRTQANPTTEPRTVTLTASNAAVTMVQDPAPPPPPNPCLLGLPQVNVTSWDSHPIKLGSVGHIGVSLDWNAEITDRTIAWVETQLGTQPPVRITTPDVLATLTMLTYRSTAKGVFNLVVRVGDSAGCTGATGAVRQVKVN